MTDIPPKRYTKEHSVECVLDLRSGYISLSGSRENRYGEVEGWANLEVTDGDGNRASVHMNLEEWLQLQRMLYEVQPKGPKEEEKDEEG